MLIKSASFDIKTYVPIDKSVTNADIFPLVNTATKKYIIPEIGPELYAELDAAYNSTTSNPTTIQNQLINLLQEAIAYFTVLEYVPLGNVKLSSSGIHIVKEGNRVAAFEWQIEKIEEQSLNNGYIVIDEVLAFLELNASSFPTWTASPAHILTKKFFINTTLDFATYYNIGTSRRTFRALWPAFKRVEDLYILPILGQAYFSEFKTQIAANNVTPDNAIVLDWIKAAFANLAIYLGFSELALRINELGITVTSTSNRSSIIVSSPAPQADRNLLLKRLKEDGEAYLFRARKYLDANASSIKYATYFNDPTVYTPPASVSNYDNFPNLITNGIYVT